ncbi:hypothetical protein ZIOFF_011344 [Zingiber officinale]|uniref:Plant heme peroxidase family profile domain-containing protein n=1 Tax=Zingiber officinale TaxID=94328 RepID=A0A8J5HIU3_ZINOF|nr:hypothetical protein ZIOFF_011344 [Zingiber officinale]
MQPEGLPSSIHSREMSSSSSSSSSSSFSRVNIVLVTVALLTVSWTSHAQLSSSFYDESCPGLADLVSTVVARAQLSDPRTPASLVRLHFHDCFVDGCDGSVLLDGSETIVSEKDAAPNKDSLRGFDVIDDIKSQVESECSGVVSCADILALAAEASVSLERWHHCQSGANKNLPSPIDTLDVLQSKFSAVGLDDTDLVTLSGAHTFGRAQCKILSSRLYNYSGTLSPDPSLDSSYLAILEENCPRGGVGTTLNNLDHATPDAFDNNYYYNLKNGQGLL